MTSNENILDSRSGTNRYMALMRAASDERNIVEAMRAYLAEWSPQKIDDLQKIDGGYGPFDESRQPRDLRDVADIRSIGDAVRRHRLALREAGISSNPEIVELDLFCFVARQVAEDLAANRRQPTSAASRGGAYPQWRNSPSTNRDVDHDLERNARETSLKRRRGLRGADARRLAG